MESRVDALFGRIVRRRAIYLKGKQRERRKRNGKGKETQKHEIARRRANLSERHVKGKRRKSRGKGGETQKNEIARRRAF